MRHVLFHAMLQQPMVSALSSKNRRTWCTSAEVSPNLVIFWLQADPAALSTLRDPAHLSRLPPKLLTKEQLEIVRQSNYTVPLTKVRVIPCVQYEAASTLRCHTSSTLLSSEPFASSAIRARCFCARAT